MARYPKRKKPRRPAIPDGNGHVWTTRKRGLPRCTRCYRAKWGLSAGGQCTGAPAAWVLDAATHAELFGGLHG